MSKCVNNLKEAIRCSGLRDGMTISFHHHLRNGDRVMNIVLEEIAALGIRDITINCSSVMDVHLPLVDHIRSGVVTGLETAYIGSAVGRQLSQGILQKPVIFRTHGGRASDLLTGRSKVDVAFVAASATDEQGNCTGLVGPSAFGGMGYADADVRAAKYKIAITDTLLTQLPVNPSIGGGLIDCVVMVDRVGDPEGIVSSTTQITKSPTRLKIAKDTLDVMVAAGLVRDGMRFQTGAGGVSLAVAKYLREKMQRDGIRGDYCLGGITGYMVEMLHDGCFERLLDAQCFDRAAIRSLSEDVGHTELTCSEYASPTEPSSKVNELDVVILGATEIDLDFNVNVHTDSFGRIMGGSGGHSDAAEGAKLTVIVAPLFRGRLCLVKDKVTTVSTPGDYIDVLVTEYGVAVNPRRKDLAQSLKNSGLKLVDIQDLYKIGIRLAGRPESLSFSKKEVASVVFRDGTVIDHIFALA